MDIILLILAKPLDKHGSTLVHISYPHLINVLIFAMFLEIFTHVVGKNVFFYSLELSRYLGRDCIKIKKQQREKGEEKVWPPAREMKFSHDHLGVREHLDCFRRHA